MRQTALLFAVLLCPATPALAQVTIDLRALDALPNARPAKPDHTLTHRSTANPVARRHAVARHTPSAPTQQQATATSPIPHGTAAAATTEPAAPPPAAAPAGQATPAPTQQQPVASTAPPSPATPAEAPREAPAPPPATLPTAPPAVVALAPIAPPAPQEAAPAPLPPPISNTATSAATTISNGLQVSFGTGQTDLSTASETAIEQLVRNTQTSDNTSFNVVAYAAGTPEDPSTARRLSLTRALAVRQALIAGGVSSARIYVRALGSAVPSGPADRVDLTVLGANLPSAIPTSGPAPPPPRQSQQQ
jgi:outer membrane protein OmpA-like peptidoglycan-associated protein